jgi:hypothetical protein
MKAIPSPSRTAWRGTSRSVGPKWLGLSAVELAQDLGEALGFRGEARHQEREHHGSVLNRAQLGACPLDGIVAWGRHRAQFTAQAIG